MRPDSNPREISPFLAGIMAMAVATALAFAWRLATGVLTPAEAVEGQFVLAIPGNLFEVGISTFGPWAKRILLVLFVLGQILLGGGIAVVVERWRISRPGSLRAAIASLTLSALAVVLVGGALSLILGGSDALGRSVAMLIFIGLAYAGVVETIRLEIWQPQAEESEPSQIGRSVSANTTLSRREVLALAAGAATVGVAIVAVGGAGSGGVSVPSIEVATAPEATPTPSSPTIPLASEIDLALTIPSGVTAEITSNADFYNVSQAILSDPGISIATWRLAISGLVSTPLALSLDDLRALPSVERQHTLTCVSNQVGGELISNATWKGVRLADVLGQAGVKPGVRKVAIQGADNYEDSITLERALDPETLLVYEMNGVSLPVAHGFPLRMLVPNIYGMKNVKWITGIELVDHAFVGTWQRGGWSDPAPIKTASRIDVPKSAAVGQSVTVGGIAFAGQRGISAVDLSPDAGKTWIPARVKHLNLSNVWTQWVAEWIPSATGSTRLLVRATDGRGGVQTSTYAAPFPDGSSGWHGVEVKVS